MVQDYDPTDVQKQERDKAEQAATKRIQQASEDDDFKWLMSSRRGRRIVWRLLSDAGVFRSTFNQNAMLMAFGEGNRNYGSKILSQIHTLCPDLYPRMVIEANERNGSGSNTQSN